MSMNPVPVNSPEARGAIARVKAQLAAEERENAAPLVPGKSEWPRSTAFMKMKQKTTEAAARKAVLPAPAPKPPTRVQRLNQLVTDRYIDAVTTQGEVNTVELDSQITASLVSAAMQDPDGMRAILEAAVRPTVHSIGQRALQKAGVQIQGDRAITIDALKERVKVRSEAVRWLEWDPAEKIYLPLHDMKRKQLMDAAVTHALESREHQEVSRWFLEMADRMDSSDATVGQTFTDNDIIRLRGLAATPSPVGHRDRV